MAQAITLRADPDGGRALGLLRDAVAVFESAPSMAALGYPPHLTLGVYDSENAIDLAGVLAALAAETTVVDLRFETMGRFDGPPLTIWAAPSASDPLVGLHAALHARIGPARCHPHYRPGAWIPHCTLGDRIRLDRESDARAFADQWRGPVSASFDRLELVTFPPVRILRSVSLAR